MKMVSRVLKSVLLLLLLIVFVPFTLSRGPAFLHNKVAALVQMKADDSGENSEMLLNSSPQESPSENDEAKEIAANTLSTTGSSKEGKGVYQQEQTISYVEEKDLSQYPGLEPTKPPVPSPVSITVTTQAQEIVVAESDAQDKVYPPIETDGIEETTIIRVPDKTRINPAIADYSWENDERSVTFEAIGETPEPFTGFEIVNSAKCGDHITWTLYSNGTLLVSGYGRMDDLSFEIPWPDEQFRERIQTVIIQDGITSIGAWFFSGCGEITDISIPSSVTTIGDYAFSGCNKLVTVSVPENINYIGKRAFSSCTSLKEFRLPRKISSIQEGTFHSCQSLTEITIPANVTSIGESAFAFCSSLAKLEIPESVTNIGRRAFDRCKALKEVRFHHESGANLTMDKEAFFQLSYGKTVFSLKILVPDPAKVVRAVSGYDWTGNKWNVSYGKLDSASDSSSANSVVASGTCGENLVWVLYGDGTMVISGSGKMQNYLYDGTPAPWHPYRDRIHAVMIEDGVTSIGITAFYNCRELKRVFIPETLTDIYTGAFSYCTALREITFPESVELLEYHALEYCHSLGVITFRHPYEGKLKIDSGAFMGKLVVPARENSAANAAQSAESAPEKNDGEDNNPYSSVIEKYEKAIADGVSTYGEAYEHGVSEWISSYDHVGYALVDLDSNGIEEMVIGGIDPKHDMSYTGPVVFEIYALSGEKAVSLFASEARSKYFLINDNKIISSGSSGANASSTVAYRLEGDHLKFVEGLSTVNSRDSSGQTVYHTTNWKTYEYSDIIYGDYDKYDYTVPVDQYWPFLRELQALYWMPDLTLIA